MTSRTPRGLPCLHSYCEDCLQKLLQPSGKGYLIICPTCRQPTKLPPSGVKSIPVNFLLLPDDGNNVEEKIAKCSFCTEKEAVVRCTDCYKDLCRDCREKHTTFSALKNHHLRSLGSNVCLDHHDTIQYMCTQCKKELCIKCMFHTKLHEEHKDKIYEIKKKCEEVKREIKTKTEDWQTHLNHKLTHLSHVKESIANAEKAVKAKMDQSINEVQKNGNYILKQLAEEKYVVDNTKERVHCIQDELKKALSFCQQKNDYTLDFHSTLDCLSVSIEKEGAEVSKVCTTEIKIPNFHAQQDVIMSVGELKYINEHTDIYPCDSRESLDPLSLNRLSTCTDTIYELFLSRKRTYDGDPIDENYVNINFGDKDNEQGESKIPPPIKSKPKIQSRTHSPPHGSSGSATM